ncbi:MAG: DUF2523 family protein [Candidatus Methanomethylicaceae archaeon]
MATLLKALLTWVLAGAVARVLAGAGLAIGTYVILSDLLDNFLAMLTSSLNSITSGFANLLWIAGVGECLSIVGSALVAVAAINSARVFIGRA